MRSAYPTKQGSSRIQVLAAAILLGLGFTQSASAARHAVTICGDRAVLPQCNAADDGTLRRALFCAQEGDSIDLSALRACKITLAAPLTDYADDVTLIGPGRGDLTIDGANRWRLFVHNGSGTLSINKMTLQNGYMLNTYDYGGGGCVYSFGNVDIYGSSLGYCRVVGQGVAAKGGAVFAKHDVSVRSSSITNSQTYSPAHPSAGGGIFADNVTVQLSTVSYNKADGCGSCGGGGGGVYGTSDADIAYSTIAKNHSAGGVAGARARNVTLTNSTIAFNTSAATTGGVLAMADAVVSNSTISGNFDRTETGTFRAGLSVLGSLVINSTIVANNEQGAIDSDFFCSGAVSGANNLVGSFGSGTPPPADTLGGPAGLGYLSDSGGPTRTVFLYPNSPAINRGNNVAHLADDQRLISERTVGARPDIGAFESDTLFVDGLEPPPR